MERTRPAVIGLGSTEPHLALGAVEQVRFGRIAASAAGSTVIGSSSVSPGYARRTPGRLREPLRVLLPGVAEQFEDVRTILDAVGSKADNLLRGAHDTSLALPCRADAPADPPPGLRDQEASVVI